GVAGGGPETLRVAGRFDPAGVPVPAHKRGPRHEPDVPGDRGGRLRDARPGAQHRCRVRRASGPRVRGVLRSGGLRSWLVRLDPLQRGELRFPLGVAYQRVSAGDTRLVLDPAPRRRGLRGVLGRHYRGAYPEAARGLPRHRYPRVRRDHPSFLHKWGRYLRLQPDQRHGRHQGDRLARYSVRAFEGLAAVRNARPEPLVLHDPGAGPHYGLCQHTPAGLAARAGLDRGARRRDCCGGDGREPGDDEALGVRFGRDVRRARGGLLRGVHKEHLPVELLVQRLRTRFMHGRVGRYGEHLRRDPGSHRVARRELLLPAAVEHMGTRHRHGLLKPLPGERGYPQVQLLPLRRYSGCDDATETRGHNPEPPAPGGAARGRRGRQSHRGHRCHL
ncbi:MAG: Branched-chain amino acid transport system permease protein LivM, partial [uncultured Rubrobacteraceae bacterium]